MSTSTPGLPGLAPLAAVLLLAGCPPWITPSRHQQNQQGDGLLTDDLEGAREECQGEPGGTAYFVGDWVVHEGREEVEGADQLAIFANDAWLDGGGADCWHTFSVEGSFDGSIDDGGATLDLAFEYQVDRSTCLLSDYYVEAAWSAQFAAGFNGEDVILSGDFGEYAHGTLDGDTIEYATEGLCIRRHEGIRESGGDSGSLGQDPGGSDTGDARPPEEG